MTEGERAYNALESNCGFHAASEISAWCIEQGVPISTLAGLASGDLAAVPREPTAENGMKAALIGEFTFKIEQHCTACHFDEPDDDCEVCGGEIEYTATVTVPWTTIKEIHKAIVAAAEKEQNDENNR